MIPRRARKPRVVIDYAMRQRVMWMLREGWTRKNCMAQCGISETALRGIIDTIKDDPERLIEATPQMATPLEPDDVRWTKAREIVATRLLRAGRSIHVIAQRLTDDFPGAPIDPLDVEVRFRGQNWPQFRRAA